MRLRTAFLLALTASTAAAGPPPPQPTALSSFGRILELEASRQGSAELAALVAHPERALRRRAALAAGRAGDAALTAALATRLGDSEVEVRRMAAYGLGLLRQPEAVPLLLKAFGDPDGVVRARAAEALGRIGGARAIEGLVAHALAEVPADAPIVAVRGDDPGSNLDPWLDLRLTLFALAEAGDWAAAERVLFRDGRARFDWWAAVWVASRFDTPAARPLLLAGAASTDPLARAFAAAGLGRSPGADTLDLLSRLAADREPAIATAALVALGRSGDARVLPLVAKALDSPSAEVVRAALDALVALPADPALRARVVGLAGHPSAWIRAAALEVLGRLDREQLALVLAGFDPDPDWRVQAATARALGSAGDDTSVAILSRILAEANPLVLPAALAALRSARGRDAAPILLAHLDKPDAAVRLAAAKELMALPGDHAAAIGASYRRAESEVDPTSRLVLLDLLASLPGGSDVVTSALADRVAAVRLHAARLLATAPAARMAAPARPPAVDARLLQLTHAPVAGGAPLYTPRLVLATRHGEIEILLNVVEAPLASALVARLARRGYYTGLEFDGVEPGRWVAGGSARGDGLGGSGDVVPVEAGLRPFGRGTVGLARIVDDVAGSRFFILRQPDPSRDGRETILGWVSRGMEAVDRLEPGDRIESVAVWDGRR